MRTFLAVLALCACSVAQTYSGAYGISGKITVKNSDVIIVPADFFVAPASGAHGSCLANGNDANSGIDISHPVATLDKARQLARPLAGTKPLTIMKCGGQYFDTAVTFTGLDSGTQANPIIYENYPGDTPQLIGGVNIGGGGWSVVTTGTCATATGNGLTCYQKTLVNTTPYFESLYYQPAGGSLARRFRPRMGATAPNLVGTYGTSTGPTTGNKGFTYTAGDPVAGWASCGSGTDCIVVGFEKWAATLQRIQSISTATHTITTTCNATCPPSTGPGPPFAANERYVIENAKELFQFKGQWYLDRSGNPYVLSYIAQNGENPNSDTVIIPKNNQVLTVSALQWVTFSGLTFQVDNYVIPSTGYISAQLDPNLTQALVSCADCVNVAFTGDTFSQTTASGLRFTGASKNVTVSGNTITDIGGYGLQVGIKPSNSGNTDAAVPNHFTVSQNWVDYTSRFFPSADCIMVGLANNAAFTSNDVGYCYDKGFEICMPASHLCGGTQTQSATTHDITISNNDIHNIGQGVLTDLAAFYSSTEAGVNNVYTNNRAHDVNGAIVQNPQEPDQGAHGLYIDDQTGSWTVTNNVTYRATANLIHMNQGPQAAGQQNVISNNIFANYANVQSGSGGCVGIQTPNTSFLSFIYKNNICIQDVAGHTLVNQGFGPPTTNSAAQQQFTQNIYSFVGTPTFNIHGVGTNVAFATWKGTYSEDTAGTISTSPGFNAAVGCANTVPNPLVCDDFTFANGVGPGFGFVYSAQSYGPTVRIAIPAVAPTFPEATLPVSSF